LRKKTKQPVRMCAVCRKRCLKVELKRYVFSQERLFFDETQRCNNRGVYIHKECVRLLQRLKPKQLEHALRLPPHSIFQSDISAIVSSDLILNV
jgi:predicted RNA-binding protein YlxR (DUF448 family)